MGFVDLDAGSEEGLTSAERKELVESSRRNRVLEMELEILKRVSVHFARVTYRALQVAPSMCFEAIKCHPSTREIEHCDLTGLIVEVHCDSRRTFGTPRIYAELQMGLGLLIGRKRVARIQREAGFQGSRTSGAQN